MDRHLYQVRITLPDGSRSTWVDRQPSSVDAVLAAMQRFPAATRVAVAPTLRPVKGPCA